MEFKNVTVELNLTVYGAFSATELENKLKQYAATLTDGAAVYSTGANVVMIREAGEEK